MIGWDAGSSPRTVVAETVMLILVEGIHDDDAVLNKLKQFPPTHLKAGMVSESHTLPEAESE